MNYAFTFSFNVYFLHFKNTTLMEKPIPYKTKQNAKLHFFSVKLGAVVYGTSADVNKEVFQKEFTLLSKKLQKAITSVHITYIQK